MTELLTIVVGTTGLIIAVVVPWVTNHGSLIKRRGERALIGFELGRELRSMSDASRAEISEPQDALMAQLIAKADESARLESMLYSRAVLRVFPAELIWGCLLYAAALWLWAWLWAPPSGAVVLTTLGFIPAAIGCFGGSSAASKRSRLRDAGISIPARWTVTREAIEALQSRQGRRPRRTSAPSA